jgi:hypothetical protein
MRPEGVASNQLPSNVWAFLNTPDEVELLSLDPNCPTVSLQPGAGPNTANRNARPDEAEFHGFKVLGRMKLLEVRARSKVVGALCKGILDSDGSVALCFNPRHALRARSGERTIGLVICYECNVIRSYIDDQEQTQLSTTRSGQSILDGYLKDAGVPLAP